MTAITDVNKLKKDLELAAMAKRFEELMAEKARERPNSEMHEFTFSQVERVQLSRQQTIKAMAEMTIDTILSFTCLPRVGVKETGLDVFFDISVGRFVVFTPRIKKNENLMPRVQKSSSESPVVAAKKKSVSL